MYVSQFNLEEFNAANALDAPWFKLCYGRARTPCRYLPVKLEMCFVFEKKGSASLFHNLNSDIVTPLIRLLIYELVKYLV